MHLDNLIKNVRKNGLNFFIYIGKFTQNGRSHLISNHRSLCHNHKYNKEYYINQFDFNHRVSCKFCQNIQNQLKKALLQKYKNDKKVKSVKNILNYKRNKEDNR